MTLCPAACNTNRVVFTPDYHLCPQHGNPRRWRTDHQKGRSRRVSCRSPKCPSVCCRWGLARYESICLARNFDARAANYPGETWYFVVLEGAFVDSCDLWATWRSFRDRLKHELKRRGLPPLVYYLRLEFTDHQEPHIHILTTSVLPKALLRRLWSCSCGPSRSSKVYWRPVFTSPQLCTAYILKARTPDRPDRFPVQVPDSWHGDMTASSRGFWLCRRPTYWSHQLDVWYPDRVEQRTKLSRASRYSRSFPQVTLNSNYTYAPIKTTYTPSDTLLIVSRDPGVLPHSRTGWSTGWGTLITANYSAYYAGVFQYSSFQL